MFVLLPVSLFLLLPVLLLLLLASVRVGGGFEVKVTANKSRFGGELYRGGLRASIFSILCEPGGVHNT